MCAGSAMMRRFVFKFESLADAQAHTQNKSVSVNWRKHASITALRQCGGFGRRQYDTHSCRDIRQQQQHESPTRSNGRRAGVGTRQATEKHTRDMRAYRLTRGSEKRTHSNMPEVIGQPSQRHVLLLGERLIFLRSMIRSRRLRYFAIWCCWTALKQNFSLVTDTSFLLSTKETTCFFFLCPARAFGRNQINAFTSAHMTITE